jgi:hypothetical protein
VRDPAPAGPCAAGANPLDDTFALSIGAFILNTNTTVRADGSAVEVGTPIDVERQLGISDRTSFRLDGYWRFLERHKIRVMYFDESRSSQKNITDEIVFLHAVEELRLWGRLERVQDQRQRQQAPRWQRCRSRSPRLPPQGGP